MTSEFDSQPAKLATRNRVKDSGKIKRRTPRACDRCRLKKAKCDGARQCMTCKASDSACIYTTRRGKEAKNYFWHMREITDEAIRQLYLAARDRTGFPGIPPPEEDGNISINAVLESMGLIDPNSDYTSMQNCILTTQSEDKDQQERENTPPPTPVSARSSTSSCNESGLTSLQYRWRAVQASQGSDYRQCLPTRPEFQVYEMTSNSEPSEQGQATTEQLSNILVDQDTQMTNPTDTFMDFEIFLDDAESHLSLPDVFLAGEENDWSSRSLTYNDLSIPAGGKLADDVMHSMSGNHLSPWPETLASAYASIQQ